MAGNGFSLIFFLKFPLSVNRRSFMIEQYGPLLSLFLIQGCTHFLRFFFFLCSCLSNKPSQEIINNPISLLLSMPAII